MSFRDRISNWASIGLIATFLLIMLFFLLDSSKSEVGNSTKIESNSTNYSQNNFSSFNGN